MESRITISPFGRLVAAFKDSFPSLGQEVGVTFARSSALREGIFAW